MGFNFVRERFQTFTLFNRICQFGSVDYHQYQSITTDQMAEWYGASASGSVDLGFDSESGQTNDFNIGIHSFPA